jgi:sugar O-acyltransferase (sialic acid O-acetyltransferase NeuD family)
MYELMIFGGPGSGTVVAQTVRRLAAGERPIHLAGFLNDVLPIGEDIAGTRVIGPFDSWREASDRVIFVAPLHKAKSMQRRAERISKLGIPEERWATIIDPAAVVADGAAIGCGSFVSSFAVVDAGVRLGRHVSLWPAAQIAHDGVVEDYVFAGRGSLVSGRCQIGCGAHLGPGAIVLEDLRVGSYAVVGAGAVVIRDVPDHAIVAGNPARIIGRVDPLDN